MNDRFKTPILPLFDASETVQSVLRYDDSRRAGGVIASDGTDVFLYPTDNLVRAAVESGGRLRLQTLEHTRLHVHAFTGDASDLGLPEGVTVASLLTTPDGRPFGFTFEDRPDSMRVVVTKKWVCSPHGETHVRLTGGQCPDHEDGTLVEV